MSIVEATKLLLKRKRSLYFYKLLKYNNNVIGAMRFENKEDLINFKESLLGYFDDNKDEKENKMETCSKCKYCLYARAPYNDFVCHNQKSKSFGKVLEHGGQVEACEDFDGLNGTKMSIEEASEILLKRKRSLYFYKLPKYEDRNDVMMAIRFENNEDLIDFKEALLRLNLIYFDNNKDDKEKK